VRVTCPHCQQKAVITSSNQLSSAVKDLYCQCMNTKDCGASFVFALAYKHDLNPPQKSTRQLAASLIMSLPLEERRQLQVDVFN
jgi:cell division protein ZapA (FtsZ GTPase activity inhibitor)